MNKKRILKTTAIFVALSVAGVCMLVFGQASGIEDLSNTLPLLGGAMFASGLTFFLVEVSRMTS